MTIIEQAREFMREYDAADFSDLVVLPDADQMYALCRALIVRTEALEQIAAYFGTRLDGDTWQERCSAQGKRYDECVLIARRALADEPHTGQGMGDASDDAADARRFRWLLPRFTAADFEYGEPNPIAVVTFAWPRAPISADLRRSIDDAMKLEATSKAGDSTPGSLRDALAVPTAPKEAK